MSLFGSGAASLTITGVVTGSGAADEVAIWSGASTLIGSTALPNGTTATTQAAADNSTKVATTAYADRMLPKAGGTMTGALLFTDNTLDIGAAGATRPRTGYFGTSVVTPLVVVPAISGLVLTSYANNAAALVGGLVAGDLYAVTGSDPLQVAVVF